MFWTCLYHAPVWDYEMMTLPRKMFIPSRDSLIHPCIRCLQEKMIRKARIKGKV